MNSSSLGWVIAKRESSSKVQRGARMPGQRRAGQLVQIYSLPALNLPAAFSPHMFCCSLCVHKCRATHSKRTILRQSTIFGPGPISGCSQKCWCIFKVFSLVSFLRLVLVISSKVLTTSTCPWMARTNQTCFRRNLTSQRRLLLSSALPSKLKPFSPTETQTYCFDSLRLW